MIESTDQRALSADQITLLTAARVHQLHRLPSGETRRYFDDGTYTTGTTGARVGELIEAGMLAVGQQHTPSVQRARWFREVELTPDGEGRLLQALHERAMAEDPTHDRSSCFCCCLTCQGD